MIQNLDDGLHVQCSCHTIHGAYLIGLYMKGSILAGDHLGRAGGVFQAEQTAWVKAAQRWAH